MDSRYYCRKIYGRAPTLPFFIILIIEPMKLSLLKVDVGTHKNNHGWVVLLLFEIVSDTDDVFESVWLINFDSTPLLFSKGS